VFHGLRIPFFDGMAYNGQDMSYVQTGRSDDLIAMLARAETRRYPKTPPVKGPWARNLVEPCFQLVGATVAMVIFCLPGSWAAAFHDRLFLWLLGGAQPLPFDADSPYIAQARALLKEGGPKSSLLCPASHPPAHGDFTYLTVEIMRHALWVLHLVAGPASKPRIIVAVDAFGLDQLQGYEQGAYGGFMSRRHLGFDRLIHGRSLLGRIFLGPAEWPKFVWRFFATLRRGVPVGFMLGGGVPATSRVYYAAREYMGRLWRERPGKRSPAEVESALKDESAFASFQKQLPRRLGYLKSTRRLVEAWVLSTMTQGEELKEVDAGRLPAATREAVAAVARALGWPTEEAARRFKDFSEEFALTTPYRERLFHLLLQRATPLVVLPLDWGGLDRVEMRLRAPVLITGSHDGRLCSVDADGQRHQEDVRTFCRRFVNASYA
jgi:hypothetical protein